MQTFLFVIALAAIAGGGWFLGVRRLRAYNEANAQRELAQLATLEALRRQPPPKQSSAPTPTPVQTIKPAATARPVAPPAADHAVHNAADSTPDTAPTTLDAADLKALRGSRFMRLSAAYFESTGFKARKYNGEDPIDALLFVGNAPTPMMALRWSRSRTRPAASREVIEFGLARTRLNIQHATFVAQHGATLNATKAAVEQGITLLTAEQLAIKIASMSDDQRRALITASQG